MLDFITEFIYLDFDIFYIFYLQNIELIFVLASERQRPLNAKIKIT